MKLRYVALTSGILVGMLISVLFITMYQKQPTPSVTPSINLVSYEWGVRLDGWEDEYVEVNITLLNSGNASAEFTLEIDLYDDEEYFGCRLWRIELPAKHEETFIKHVPYELLINKYRANAIEIICGIYGEDDVIEKLCFREFSSMEQA